MHCVIGRLVAPCTVVQCERHDGSLVESSMLHMLLWICVSEYPSSVTTIVQVGQVLIDNGHRGDCSWTGSLGLASGSIIGVTVASLSIVQRAGTAS